jgi:predicted outer membrane protein
MIKIDFKGPKPGDLVRAASAEIEKQFTAKAKAATARHGGVSVRFTRKADGTVRSVEFQGSPAAIEAAKLAIERSR